MLLLQESSERVNTRSILVSLAFTSKKEMAPSCSVSYMGQLNHSVRPWNLGGHFN